MELLREWRRLTSAERTSLSFNPCSNGITTRVLRLHLRRKLHIQVSILVLMELLRE